MIPSKVLSSLISLLWTALLSTAVLFALRTTVRWAVQQLPLPSRIKSNYHRYDTFTYSVFLLFLLGAGGINQLSIPFFYILGFAFLAAQFLLAFLLLKNTQEGDRLYVSLGWLSFLFLLSGVAALIYQIVWQRLLFAAYGVNIESVTIIVSIFMFGLGVGSLVGGILSKRFPSHLPQLFVLCEVAIGCFGIASLPLIRLVTYPNWLKPLFVSWLRSRYGTTERRRRRDCFECRRPVAQCAVRLDLGVVVLPAFNQLDRPPSSYRRITR